jgi:hypothetical protein
MRSLIIAFALIVLVALLSASTPLTLDSRAGSHLVQASFIDGLPRALEPTRIAITVVEPVNRTVPDEPAILMLTGDSASFRITLDPVPTTIVSLPGLEAGSYDLRIYVPDEGMTDALEIRIGEDPLFEANPLLGGVLVLMGLALFVFIFVSDRFGKRR